MAVLTRKPMMFLMAMAFLGVTTFGIRLRGIMRIHHHHFRLCLCGLVRNLPQLIIGPGDEFVAMAFLHFFGCAPHAC